MKRRSRVAGAALHAKRPSRFSSKAAISSLTPPPVADVRGERRVEHLDRLEPE